MWESLITPGLVEAAASLVAVLLTIGISRLGHLLSRKVESDYAQSVIARAATAAHTAVRSIEQEFVSEIRKDRSDGRLTTDEMRSAAGQALDRAKHQLGDKGLKELARVLGADSVDAWLAQVIEAMVGEHKKGAS